MNYWTALFLIFSTLISGCGQSSSAGKKSGQSVAKPVLRVATAANVQFAVEELAERFEALYDIKVEPTISSSGKLTAQIVEGAPYHLFLSANMKYPQALLKQQAAVGEVKVYAEGLLVAWTLNELEPEADPAYLQQSTVRKIALANPKNAPYGLEAIHYLEHFGVLGQVQDKLVYGESIAQTNQYIVSRAVDVGLTAKSVVLSPEMQSRGRWVELPAGSYEPITQGVVVTAYGQKQAPEASQLFFDFLSSPDAQQIFKKYGYRVPVNQNSTQ
jgi:molybdate transport system substrate-binding protein